MSQSVDQHTPGPWEVGDDDAFPDGIPFIEVSAGDCPSPSYKMIAHVQPEYDDEKDDWFLSDEDRANARLIAAAPELLSALQDFCLSAECAAGVDEGAPQDEAYSEILSWGGSALASSYDTARAAIAKATLSPLEEKG